MLTLFTLTVAQGGHCYSPPYFEDVKTEEPALSHVVTGFGAGV